MYCDPKDAEMKYCGIDLQLAAALHSIYPFADCLSTLPGLIERDAQCSLHFYFANFEGMRRTLFPRLVESYRRRCETGSPAPLLDAARAGTAYWADAASRLIDLRRKDPANAEAAIEKMLGGEPAALAL